MYDVNSESEANEIIESLKKEHKKAKHIVYAYKIDSKEKSHSDKEPTGTTRGLLDIIKMKDLNHTMIIVIRYFGGILLGSGPLTRTYTKCAALLVKE